MEGVREHKGFLQIRLQLSYKKEESGPHDQHRLPTLELTNKLYFT